ncbi:farnesyl pyrophosphate synthase [Fennellomyces sp. T-0311]|nr:farnesyl pyrophosphate synthase [Fennellomyces sp. T-0311]
MLGVKFQKEENRKAFIEVFRMLADDVLAEIRKCRLPSDAYNWAKESLYYNVPGGKLTRGLSVVDTVRILKGDAITDDDIFKASVLGWLIEFLQGACLVEDDIEDGSTMRRGKPCWYRKDGIGMFAINDAGIIESSIYIILKKYFKNVDYYVDLVELFHDITFKTGLGQMCDLITSAPADKVDFSKFTVNNHHTIVVYKTAYYSFYLPVALAMYMAGIKDKAAFNDAEKILIPLGEYYQIQDDYLDCYGDPKVLGKVGTDIPDNRCSWLVNQALARASTEQRVILETYYGKRDDAAAEAKVKQLYHELDLESIYKAYEDKSFKDISALIDKLDESVGLKKQVFIEFMEKIYRRTS